MLSLKAIFIDKFLIALLWLPGQSITLAIATTFAESGALHLCFSALAVSFAALFHAATTSQKFSTGLRCFWEGHP